MHNGCFYDLLTAVLVVGNPKGSIGRSSMIYMMVKKIKKNASAIQNNIVTSIISFFVCFSDSYLSFLQIKQLG